MPADGGPLPSLPHVRAGQTQHWSEAPFMGKSREDFTSVLLKKKIISPEQLEEARNFHHKTGLKLEEALVKMKYASAAEVTEAKAVVYGVEFVDLEGITIPPSVIELVPESVARENVVLPM